MGDRYNAVEVKKRHRRREAAKYVLVGIVAGFLLIGVCIGIFWR